MDVRAIAHAETAPPPIATMKNHKKNRIFIRAMGGGAVFARAIVRTPMQCATIDSRGDAFLLLGYYCSARTRRSAQTEVRVKMFKNGVGCDQ